MVFSVIMYLYGPVAHLVERLACTEEVAGSSPVRSTQKNLNKDLKGVSRMRINEHSVCSTQALNRSEEKSCPVHRGHVIQSARLDLRRPLVDARRVRAEHYLLTRNPPNNNEGV